MTAKRFVKGDKPTLKFQLTQNGAARDITGMTFKLTVKQFITNTVAVIGPVNGALNDVANGKFSFTLDLTNTAPVRGKMEIAMYDGAGNRTTLTPPGGVDFSVIENIID